MAKSEIAREYTPRLIKVSDLTQMVSFATPHGVIKMSYFRLRQLVEVDINQRCKEWDLYNSIYKKHIIKGQQCLNF